MYMHYQQLTRDQRYIIYALKREGFSQAYIARRVGVHRSTVCREFKRNKHKRGWRPKLAAGQGQPDATPLSKGAKESTRSFHRVALLKRFFPSHDFPPWLQYNVLPMYPVYVLPMCSARPPEYAGIRTINLKPVWAKLIWKSSVQILHRREW
jgi:hypothetical protein